MVPTMAGDATWNLPFADEVPCFKSGQSAPDAWIDKAIAEIRKAGGEVTSHAFGHETNTGRAAFLLAFSLGTDDFRITWPVLPTKRDEERAAKIQAATLLYHDVKAKCVKARIFGMRTAFF